MSETNSQKSKPSLASIQIEHLAWHLSRSAGGTQTEGGVTLTSLAVAYVLYLAACDEDCRDIPDLRTFLAEKEVDTQLRSFIVDRIGKDWKNYRQLIKRYPKDEILQYLLGYNATGKLSGWMSTPDSVSMLALRLLDVKKGGAIADICCGTGNFLKNAVAHCPGVTLTGLEISAESACVAKMRLSAIDDTATIMQCDALDAGAKFSGKFDYVFCDPPYNMPIDHIHAIMVNGELRTDYFPPAFPSLKGRATTEWVWLLKALEMLKPGGKAAILMPMGRMFSTSQEAQCRRFLVENGYVESVVALPGGLLDYTAIRLALVILGQGNGKVKLVDADGLCLKRRGGNIMTETHVERIAKAKDGDGICHVVPYAEIAANGFSLDPASYGREIPEVPCAVPLSEVVVSIGRGMAIGRGDAEDAPDNSPVRLVTVSDICDGRISDSLKPLPGAPGQYSRYVIEDGDVIVGKVPTPFKAAVAEVPDGVTLVASVNLYILKVDKSKCDPYYLQAFLCSKLGQAQLADKLKGNVLLTLPAEGLARIPFPKLPLEEQEAFADTFIQKLEFVKVARKQAEKAAKEAETAFDAFLAKEDGR